MKYDINATARKAIAKQLRDESANTLYAIELRLKAWEGLGEAKTDEATVARDGLLSSLRAQAEESKGLLKTYDEEIASLNEEIDKTNENKGAK